MQKLSRAYLCVLNRRTRFVPTFLADRIARYWHDNVARHTSKIFMCKTGMLSMLTMAIPHNCL